MPPSSDEPESLRFRPRRRKYRSCEQRLPSIFVSGESCGALMASDYSSVTASATGLVDRYDGRVCGARPIVKSRSWHSITQIDEPHATASVESVPSTRGILLSAVRRREVSQRLDLPANRAGPSQHDAHGRQIGSYVLSADTQSLAVPVYPSGDQQHSYAFTWMGQAHSSPQTSTCGGISGSGAYQRTGPMSPGSLASAGASSLGSPAKYAMPLQHVRVSAGEEEASWIAHVDALATAHRRQIHPRSHTLPELHTRPAEYRVDSTSNAFVPRPRVAEHGLPHLAPPRREGSYDRIIGRHGFAQSEPLVGLLEPPGLRNCGLASSLPVGRIATFADTLLPDVGSEVKAEGLRMTASSAPQVKCEAIPAMVRVSEPPARSAHVSAHAPSLSACVPIRTGGSSTAAELRGQPATVTRGTGILRNIAFAAEDREAALSRASALLPASDDDTDSDEGASVALEGAPAPNPATAGNPAESGALAASGAGPRREEAHAAVPPQQAALKHAVEGSDIDEVIAALLGF